MNEAEIRDRLRDVIGDAKYPPALADRVASRIQQPSPPSHSSRWLGLTAGALAVLIVLSLVYVRAHSANPVRPSSSSTQIPAEVMERTGLNPVAGLISRPNIHVSLEDRTITLVAAYADPVQMTLIFRVLPVTQGLTIRVLDGPVAVIPWGHLTPGPDGFQYISYSGLRPGPDGKARLQTILADPLSEAVAATPVRFTPPQTTFSFDLKVWPATQLAIQQGPIAVGSWKVTIETFEATPLWIYMFAVVAGAPEPTGSIADSVVVDSIALLDRGGAKLGPGFSGAHWGVSPPHPRQWELNYHWYATGQADTYTLVITGGGGSYTTSIPIPGRPTH